MTATAQYGNIQFHREFGRSGINFGKVNAIARDQQGAKWLSDQSNEAIIRFDGAEMSIFGHSPSDPQTLGGHYPECLTIDSAGLIWIGFYGQGLDQFDLGNHTFTRFRQDPDDETSLPSDTVSAILIDSHGNFWVGTTQGVAVMESPGVFRQYSHAPSNPRSLSNNVVRTIYEDRQGVIWVGTVTTGRSKSKQNKAKALNL